MKARTMTDGRVEKLNEIAAQVRACTLCDLHKTRKQAVPGAGDGHAEILFIGEGPGEQEDRQGLPFVGRSGIYLEKKLASIGLTRDQVFIANVVKCRPPDNRDPLPLEMATCKSYLDHQIEVLDPLVIVTLGRFSMARYFPTGKITQIHGQPRFEDRRAYIPLFHPAAILRNPPLEPQMQADFNRILEVLEQARARRLASAMPPTSASSPPSQDTPPDQDAPPIQLTLF